MTPSKMKLLASFFLIVFAAAAVLAQPTTTRGPINRTPPRTRDQERAALLRRMDAYRNLSGSGLRTSGPLPSGLSRKGVEKRLKITKSERNRYQLFLKTDGSSIFKLLTPVECVSVLNSSSNNDCIKSNSWIDRVFNSFSFRSGRYVPKMFADITLADGKFDANLTQVQTILSDIGETDLEKLNLQSPELKGLVDFVPATNLAEAQTQFEYVRGGFDRTVSIDGIEKTFRYSKSADVVTGHTYAIRAIAYSLEGFTEIEDTNDVIAVFTVAGKDELGTLTILYRELVWKDAPFLAAGSTVSDSN